MTVAVALLAAFVASASAAAPAKRSTPPAPTGKTSGSNAASGKPAPLTAGSKRAQDQIELAQNLLEDLDYERALERLAAARLEGPSAEQELTIALLEGTLQVELGRLELGKLSFRRALLGDPGARLPLDVSPKVKSAFESVRDALHAERREVPVVLVAPPVPGPDKTIEAPAGISAQPPAQVTSGGTSPAVIATAAAGGALLVGGGVFYFVARDSEQRLRNGDPAIGSREVAVEVRQAGETRQTVAFALGSVGLAAGAVAAGLMMFGDSSEQVTVAPLQGGALVGFGGYW